MVYYALKVSKQFEAKNFVTFLWLAWARLYAMVLLNTDRKKKKTIGRYTHLKCALFLLTFHHYILFTFLSVEMAGIYKFLVSSIISSIKATS